MPYGILLKVIELFYDCQTIIPANSVSDMHKALHFLQVDSVMDFGQMPPPMNAPNSGPRPMYTDAQAAFNRRQTMANMEPMIDLKRRRTNMVPIPAQIRPSFEQVTLTPNICTFVRSVNFRCMIIIIIIAHQKQSLDLYYLI